LLPVMLLLAGGVVSLYCLWQLRTWLREMPQPEQGKDPVRLEALVDELVATAETTVAMVQERSEALTAAVAQADRRLIELSAAVKAAPVTAVPAAASAALSEPPLPVVPGPEPKPEPEPEPDLEPEPQPEPGRELHTRVYRLADQGHDVTAIARQMGLTKGEVLLILGLRQGARSL